MLTGRQLQGIILWKTVFALSGSVSIGYTPTMKDVGLRIRIEKELRDRFVEACRRKDVPAAQVLRGFMRGFVDEEGEQAAPSRKTKRQKTTKGRAG